MECSPILSQIAARAKRGHSVYTAFLVCKRNHVNLQHHQQTKMAVQRFLKRTTCRVLHPLSFWETVVFPYFSFIKIWFFQHEGELGCVYISPDDQHCIHEYCVSGMSSAQAVHFSIWSKTLSRKKKGSTHFYQNSKNRILASIIVFKTDPCFSMFYQGREL